jgi:thiol-disulfide isomerase/thioredoxin
MKIRTSLFSLLIVAATLVSACGVVTPTPAAVATATPTPEAMMGGETPTPESMMSGETPTSESMMSNETPTPESMMSGETPTPESMMSNETPTPESMMSGETPTPESMMSGETPTPESMMTNETPTPESMMSGETPTPEAMTNKGMAAPEGMTDQGMMEAPAWYGADLTDVNTGTAFKVADLKGKVVLVETMAVWCPTCLQQASQIQALNKLLGKRDDFVSLGLDIDQQETADVLKAYTAKNGFDWPYAVAPAAVAHEIGQLYGDQFLNPPSTPILIIDRQGQAHPLPFGVKSAQVLQEALSPYLK